MLTHALATCAQSMRRAAFGRAKFWPAAAHWSLLVPAVPRACRAFSAAAGGQGGGGEEASTASTIFSRPTLGGHGFREGGLADRTAKEDEELRQAIDNDPVGRAKMQCLAWGEDSPEYEEAFLRLMRYLVNSPRVLVCATDADGITPFVAHGDWRRGEGNKVQAVSAMVFTNDKLADMHGPTRSEPKKVVSGSTLVSTLAQLLPHTPGRLIVNLNGVFEVPFPNKALGACMTARRNRQLALAIARGSVGNSAGGGGGTGVGSESGTGDAELIRDCASAADAEACFRDAKFFQVSVHGDPLVTQCDSLGLVLPLFTAPAQAIAFLRDVVTPVGAEEQAVTMDDVTIRAVSGAELVEQLEQRDESSNWLGGLTLDPLPEGELLMDEDAQVLRRRPDDVPETVLSRRDLRGLFSQQDNSSSILGADRAGAGAGGADVDVEGTASGADALRKIGVFQSFDDAAAEGLGSRRH